MTTIRTEQGTTLVRRNQGDVVVVNARHPDPLTVIADPTGKLGEIMRLCAARDKQRKEAR
jgi:hypothetical protein